MEIFNYGYTKYYNIFILGLYRCKSKIRCLSRWFQDQGILFPKSYYLNVHQFWFARPWKGQFKPVNALFWHKIRECALIIAVHATNWPTPWCALHSKIYVVNKLSLSFSNWWRILWPKPHNWKQNWIVWCYIPYVFSHALWHELFAEGTGP